VKKADALKKLGLPGQMAEVVLFDAINTWGQLSSVKSWVLEQLNSELAVIAAESDPAKQLEFVTTKGMRFRGYHSPTQYQVKDKDGTPLWEDEAKKIPKLDGYAHGSLNSTEVTPNQR